MEEEEQNHNLGNHVLHDRMEEVEGEEEVGNYHDDALKNDVEEVEEEVVGSSLVFGVYHVVFYEALEMVGDEVLVDVMVVLHDLNQIHYHLEYQVHHLQIMIKFHLCHNVHGGHNDDDDVVDDEVEHDHQLINLFSSSKFELFHHQYKYFRFHQHRFLFFFFCC